MELGLNALKSPLLVDCLRKLPKGFMTSEGVGSSGHAIRVKIKNMAKKIFVSL
jgi:hypothetical protein